jgi:hypothetical protein
VRRRSSVSAGLVRSSSVLILGAVVAAGLISCSAPAQDDSPSATASPSAAASASPTPTATPDPVLVPEGTAADNLPLFAAVTAKVWASPDQVKGRAYVDALVAAGFAKDRMQVTADRTTVGNPVESLLFSVAWGDKECLIGQVGPSTGDPVTEVMPQLAEGRCLIGETRPIDW